MIPGEVRVEVLGGDPFGRVDRPTLSWWLPPGSSRQDAYQIRTDDGYDTGQVASSVQSFVEVPLFDVSRRSCGVQVRVWTDVGLSAWSAPVPVESGLLDEADAADDERYASWVHGRTAELARHGVGVYFGDTDFTRRTDRFLSTENLRRLSEIRAVRDPHGVFASYHVADATRLNTRD